MPIETTKTRRERIPLNGVDTPALFKTLDVVRSQPELAKVQFRARNRWKNGTLSETTIDVGADRAPLPVEYVLHALAACIMGGIGNIAAARGIALTEVKSHVEGDQEQRDEASLELFQTTDEIASFHWNLSEVRVLHEAMAKSMSREVKQLVGAGT